MFVVVNAIIERSRKNYKPNFPNIVKKKESLTIGKLYEKLSILLLFLRNFFECDWNSVGSIGTYRQRIYFADYWIACLVSNISRSSIVAGYFVLQLPVWLCAIPVKISRKNFRVRLVG